MKVRQMWALLEACEPEDELYIELPSGVYEITGFTYDANTQEAILFPDMTEEEEEDGAVEDEEEPEDLCSLPEPHLSGGNIPYRDV